MKDLGETLFIIAQIIAYILAVVIVIQILKTIFGGSWRIEEVILALLIFNLTITFGIGGYLIHSHNHLNSKISDVDKKLEGHIGWHRGKGSVT